MRRDQHLRADEALRAPYPLDALGAETQGLIGYWLGVYHGYIANSDPAAPEHKRHIFDGQEKAPIGGVL